MKKLFLFIAAVMCAASVVWAQEIATWPKFRKGAATFTFDDGAPSHIADVAPLFDRFGYKATFYLVVNWEPDWEGFQALADNGHEIGSHSNSHPNNMTGEEASSKQNIDSHITQPFGCLTVAYPNCNVPNETAVEQNYIAGRICNGSWQGQPDINSGNGPSNWCKVSAIMTGAEGINNTNEFTGKMQTAIIQSGWVVFLTHGITNKNNGNANYSLTDLSAIDGALRWAQQNDEDIWISSMRNVAMYIKERQAMTFELKAEEEDCMTYSFTHDIADNVCAYNYPLSLRVRFDKDWEEIEVKQAENTLACELKNGFLYFDAVPNGGDIQILHKTDTGLEEISAIHRGSSKLLLDGELYILRDEQIFNAQGARVK